jgi:hypothetical protein
VDVEAVMEEIAEKARAAPSLDGRTYGWPVGKVSPPAAIVAYPSKATFDVTYGRGVDSMTGALVVIVGAVAERQTRAQAAKYLAGDGAESIKAKVDGEEGSNAYASCDSVTVTGWETDTYAIGANDHLALVFALDITGPGTA